jgi:hypothetical protein
MNPSDLPVPFPAPTLLEGPDSEAQFHLAFARMEQKIRAVPESDFRTMNLDVTAIVAQVLGAVPKILKHRSILALMPTFDISQVDHLQDYALALGSCHADYRAAAEPSDDVPRLVQEQRQLREQLHADAAALANRGQLDAERVARLQGGNAYRMVAFDVLGLVQLFLENWNELAGKTALTVADLEQARAGASQLIHALGRRKQLDSAVTDVSHVRRQAYALLVLAYSDVRRALDFTRREVGDAEDIAPSLFAERGKQSGATKRRKAAQNRQQQRDRGLQQPLSELLAPQPSQQASIE